MSTSNAEEHRLFLALANDKRVAQVVTDKDRTTGEWRVDYVQAFGKVIRRKNESAAEFLETVMEGKR